MASPSDPFDLLPGGWPDDHFSKNRLVDIANWSFFSPLRQSGYEPGDPVLQDEMKAVWRQYKYIRDREGRENRPIKNPGGLMWRLLRGAVNRIRDEHGIKSEPAAAAGDWIGIVRNTDG